MTIELGGVTLHPDMVWEERYARSEIAQSVRRTIGGAVVFENPVTAALPITLATREGTGYLTRAQVDQVRALAEVLGGQHTLAFHGETFTVRFRHADAPAVEFEPRGRSNRPGAERWMRGRIKLMTA